MSAALTQRSASRIDHPDFSQGLNGTHRVRPLMPPGDWDTTDPFLLMMEDWFPTGVFDRHPHRGIETVTYVIEGTVNHYDNHGNTGTIRPGDALWMTAGRGIVHNELPADGQTVHTLQLWVNLPRASKLVPARFQELRGTEMPVRREAGAEVRVFSGESGAHKAATLNYASVTLVEVRLQTGAVVEQALPAESMGFVVVLDGAGEIGDSATVAAAGDVAWLTRSDAASVVTLRGGDRGLRALVIAGQPLHEPVAARGPFVMNTETELDDAYSEYRTQGERFGM
jgi:redox-sensitive bicupin YhaK (pirin superfamily)